MGWRPGVALASAAIIGYQRYVSPHKGFRCAYGALHGGPGCSEAVRRLIEAHGLLAVRPLVRARMVQCRRAALALRAQVLAQAALGQSGEERKKERKDGDCGEFDCGFGDCFSCGDCGIDC